MGPYRRLIALSASGMLLILGFLFIVSGGHPLLGVACGLDVLVLVACRLDRRREERLLLGEGETATLSGLEYRVTRDAIEFVWEPDGAHQWVRVLRSATVFPGTADDAARDRDVELVYEGVGGRFADAGARPLTDYRYAFFARSGDGWRIAARVWVDAATPLDTFVTAQDGGVREGATPWDIDRAGRPSIRAVDRADDDWRR